MSGRLSFKINSAILEILETRGLLGIHVLPRPLRPREGEMGRVGQYCQYASFRL